MISLNLRTFVTAAGIAAITAMGASSVSAATVCAVGDAALTPDVTGPDANLLEDVTVTYDGTEYAAKACAGVFSGNDESGGGAVGSALLNDGIFADYASGWAFQGSSSGAGSGVTADNDQLTGGFDIDFSPLAYSTFAVTQKAAKGFVVWLFDVSPITIDVAEGDFDMFAYVKTKGNEQTSIDNPDLSHLAVYTFGDGVVVNTCNENSADWVPETQSCGGDTTPNTVPLPAGMPLMLTILGVGAYMRKRARKAA
ncbi:MAG: VPLPA-CTERM sorting domain-containing protein [Roseobacter sp.]